MRSWLAAVVLAGACAAVLAQDAAPPLQGTTWVLTEAGGTAVKVPDGRRAPTLVLQEGTPARFNGHGGCNRIMGTYELQASSLTFGAAAATRMMCPDAMALESAYTNALTKVRTWHIDGRALHLQDAARQTLLRFEGTPAPAPPATLSFVNRVWRVERSSAIAAGMLYVFLSDGTLVITSPGNRPMVGRWQFAGGALTMIEEGISYRVDILESGGDRLRLRSHNPGGAVELTLRVAPPAAP